MAIWKVPFSTEAESTFKYSGDTYKITQLKQNKFNDTWFFDIESYNTGQVVQGVKLVGGINMLEAINIGLPSLFAFNQININEEPSPANMNMYVIEGIKYG